MALNDDVADLIKSLMRERGLSLRGLGTAIGRSHNWVGNKLRGDSELTLSDIEVIAPHLDTTALQLFEKATGGQGRDTSERTVSWRSCDICGRVAVWWRPTCECDPDSDPGGPDVGDTPCDKCGAPWEVGPVEQETLEGALASHAGWWIEEGHAVCRQCVEKTLTRAIKPEKGTAVA
jgi:transcriptional regulator with XRE-family HTH domain